jgi:hypothetical protein
METDSIDKPLSVLITDNWTEDVTDSESMNAKTMKNALIFVNEMYVLQC